MTVSLPLMTAGSVLWGCVSESHSGGIGGSATSSGGSGGIVSGVGGKGSGGLSGQGGSSGGLGGASASGGTTGGGGSGGATGAPVFTDDFEGATISSKWTRRINGGGTFALDPTQKHGGNQSLHVIPNNGFSTLLAVEGSPVFPAPNNTFFGRVWLRGPELPVATGGPHVIWMEAGDVTNDTHEVRIGMNLGYLQTNLYFNGEVDLRDPSAVMMANTWACIEFKMGPDELVVWLNGTQSTAISTTSWARVGNGANGGGNSMANWSPTYAAFRLGWELSAGTSEIWYDDVALGHARIGCQ